MVASGMVPCGTIGGADRGRIASALAGGGPQSGMYGSAGSTRVFPNAAALKRRPYIPPGPRGVVAWVGRADYWIEIRNPDAPAVRSEHAAPWPKIDVRIWSISGNAAGVTPGRHLALGHER